MRSRVRHKQLPRWPSVAPVAEETFFGELDDVTFQASMLAGVSRTFALTIPQLPDRLRFVVSNAYLLCRILDTIEDEPALSSGEKAVYFKQFEDLVCGTEPADGFAADLAGKLTADTIEAEHELVRQSPRVLSITRGFGDRERQVLGRCIRIMSRGMKEFQDRRSERFEGLETLEEMNRYCYYVAGVVGETLTQLFCESSPEMARRRGVMMRLAPSFGQGLQMTNIIKDIWEDRKRSICWLPRDVVGTDRLEPVLQGRDGEREHFREGLRKLSAVTHGHLRRALDYSLHVPPHDTGTRKFCLWAVGMALLTLRKIQTHPGFLEGGEVKISRSSVKATIAVTHLLVRRDSLLRGAFTWVGRSLPPPPGDDCFAPPDRGGDDANASKPPLAAPVETVGAAVSRASDYLRRQQRAEGFWCFHFEADCTITAEYILWMHFCDEIDDSLQEAMARYLRRRQVEDGGWPLYYGGEGEISCSVKTYYALKLAGDDCQAPHMRRARERIHALGGAARANVFTRITLAQFGQVPWRAVPFIPVEIMLLPKWFPFHMRKIAYWSRTVLAPLLVLYSDRARAANPTGRGVAELFVRPPERERDYFPTRSWINWVFLKLERTARLGEPLIPGRLRRLATRRAVDWFSERLNATHGLGAIFPAMVNAHEAYVTLGYGKDDPRRAQAKNALENLVVRQGDEAYCQPCVSPVWDTALAALALGETGERADREASIRGLDWLKERQLLDDRGDWSEARPDLPGGGWPFQFENAYYPDLDDTALVAFAMARTEDERYRISIERAANWLAGMQSRNGGFASFELDNTHYYLNEIPFADHGALLDPPTADVSARCAMLFGLLGGKTEAYQATLRRTVDFLCREQEEDGAWFGRWGTNYVYGTWSVLLALEQINPKPDGVIERAVAWLQETQRPDGGWGESNHSFHDPSLRGRAERSTAFQTAWALLGLMAAGRSRSEAVTRGIHFLLENQTEDGLWSDPEFTCPGFPRVFYLKYHGYDKFFPLWALARYRREINGDDDDGSS